MGSIYLNGIRYGGLSGPPEGDQVYINPIVSQGIKIAEITVNDTTDSLYTPGGVINVEVDGTSVVSQQGIAEIDLSGKQDALTAGTNISIDSSTNTISATDTTYNVFSTSNNGLVPAPTSADSTKVLQGDGTWVAQTGGTDVEANPSATATDTLNKIGIDGTVYGIVGGGGSGNVDDVYVNGESVLDANHIAQIKSYKEVTQSQYDALPSSKTSDGILYAITDAGGGGGGGTTVIANPSGEATDELTKIQIENIIYDIESGTKVKINDSRIIAWKNITSTQYEALSSAEKNNGVIYLVSENAQGASGFFTAWKSVLTAPSTADNILYLESENANGAMNMEITLADKIPTENDNNLYFIGGR